MRYILAGLALMFSVALLVSTSATAGDAPKYTIKDVMKQAHKEGLLKKVTGGDGSAADKAKLVELYEALSKNNPPKGSADEWKTRTNAIVVAAKGVASGDAAATTQLGKAANCAACHKAHK